MKSKFPTKQEQFSTAQLVYPYFKYLKGSITFNKDIKDIRVKFWIQQTESTIHSIQLFVLHQEFWEREFDWMSIVMNSWIESKKIWELFHKEIEQLSRKYRLRNFPNLIKDYVITGRFDDLFLITKLSHSDYEFQITVPRDIKKMDFDAIWNTMQKHNQKYPINKSYSKIILERSALVDKIDTKLADQKDILLLIDKVLFNDPNNKIEENLTFGDKSRKSKLKRIVRDLFSLLNQLNRWELHNRLKLESS